MKHGAALRSLGAWSALLGLGFGTVLAAPLDTFRGSLEFSTASFAGTTSATNDRWTAAYLTSESVPRLAESWNLRASIAVVNRSQAVFLAVGSNPNDPDGSLVSYRTQNQSQEASYKDVALSSLVASKDADLLLLPLKARRFDVLDASRLNVEKASDEKWVAGFRPSGAIQGDNDAAFLTKTFKTTPGQPAFRSDAAMTWDLEGDFVLYVWGTNVTVKDSMGRTDTYRSGAWWTNDMGPAARERQAQFLRITLTNATLALHHEAGRAEWTAPDAILQTLGTVQYGEASGALESATRQYAPHGTSFQIVGTVRQTIDARALGVGGAVEAHDAQTNLAPAAVVPAPHESSGPVWWLAWLGVGLVALAGGALAYPHMRSRVWQHTYDQTQAALDAGRWGEAERYARRMIRLLRHHESGWLLWAKARLAHGSPDDVIHAVEPVVASLDRPGPVALLLALAHSDQGRGTRAKAWARVALEDRALVEDMGHDPEFWALIGRLRGADPDRGYV